MEYIKICNSELTVSRLCFGGCPMGGYGWGEVSQDELITAVNEALDKGLNFFDTADIYGLGESEITLGKALGNRRKNAVIATKFGVRRTTDGRTYYDNSPEWIEIAVYESLKRLNTDYIDLYQIHYRDGKTPISSVIDTLEKLKDKGVIRYYGLSNVYLNTISELQSFKGKFVSFQDEYSLANRENEEDIKVISEEYKMTPLTWGSLGQGILSGKYSQDTKFSPDDRRSREVYRNFHGEKLIKNLKIVDELRCIADETGYPIPSIAIRWILDYIKNSVVLVGIKHKSQLESNLAALNWNLSAMQIKILNNISNDEYEKELKHG